MSTADWYSVSVNLTSTISIDLYGRPSVGAPPSQEEPPTTKGLPRRDARTGSSKSLTDYWFKVVRRLRRRLKPEAVIESKLDTSSQ